MSAIIPEDLQRLQMIVEQERKQRRARAPTTQYALSVQLTIRTMITVAAIYTEPPPMVGHRSESMPFTNRIKFMWDNDPIFRILVDSHVAETMQLLDDYGHGANVNIWSNG